MMAAARVSSPIPAVVTQWWSTKASRERRVLTTLIGMASAIVLWALLWQPLVRDLAAMRLAQGQGAANLVAARRMAEEMHGLSRAPAPAAPADDRASLERVLAQHGMRGGAIQITWQDGRAHLVFAAVGYDALVAALEALQRDARLRVIEATLTARVEPRTVRAELTLGR
jgi:type II secretory pathway component PulM